MCQLSTHCEIQGRVLGNGEGFFVGFFFFLATFL